MAALWHVQDGLASDKAALLVAGDNLSSLVDVCQIVYWFLHAYVCECILHLLANVPAGGGSPSSEWAILPPFLNHHCLSDCVLVSVCMCV